MSASANENIARLAIEAIWNRGHLDVADELFAVGYVNHNGLITDLVAGPESIKISAALHRLAFPDLCVLVDELSTDREVVVLRWTASSGTAPRQKSLTGVVRSRFGGGKIVESWTEWDGVGMLSDLGLTPHHRAPRRRSHHGPETPGRVADGARLNRRRRGL
jgi:SnoaL-like polyketide cyclase